MTVTVTLRERGSNAFLELRSLFIKTGTAFEAIADLSCVGISSCRVYCGSPTVVVCLRQRGCAAQRVQCRDM